MSITPNGETKLDASSAPLLEQGGRGDAHDGKCAERHRRAQAHPEEQGESRIAILGRWRIQGRQGGLTECDMILSAFCREIVPCLAIHLHEDMSPRPSSNRTNQGRHQEPRPHSGVMDGVLIKVYSLRQIQLLASRWIHVIQRKRAHLHATGSHQAIRQMPEEATHQSRRERGIQEALG